LYGCGGLQQIIRPNLLHPPDLLGIQLQISSNSAYLCQLATILKSGNAKYFLSLCAAAMFNSRLNLKQIVRRKTPFIFF
jgi:hypothetical protein